MRRHGRRGVAAMTGRRASAVWRLERDLDVAAAHELEDRLAGACRTLGARLGELYELDAAERWLRAHIAFADQHDLDTAPARASLAAVLVYRGQWPAGTVLAAGLLAEPVTSAPRITAGIALGRVRARRGDPGLGDALDEALAGAHGHVQQLGHVRAARAEAAWLAGNHEATVAEARAAYPRALDERDAWVGGELAYWQWTAGELGETPAWIAEPYRLQITGQAAAAAELWRHRGCPYEAARALAESDLAADVTVALAGFEHLGAGPAARAARERLRGLGAPVPRAPRRATRANPGSLTTREVEVLRLTAEGLRNLDVAERLVVSPRTVAHHVSAILRKLDAKTRGEAVFAAARLGLLDTT